MCKTSYVVEKSLQKNNKLLFSKNCLELRLRLSDTSDSPNGISIRLGWIRKLLKNWFWKILSNFIGMNHHEINDINHQLIHDLYSFNV